MNVVFIDVDKNKFISEDENIKYIVISNKFDEIEKYNNMKIKPIMVLFNGSYVIDLENNNVIIDKYISQMALDKIMNYSNDHNVEIKKYNKGNFIYQMELNPDNPHRRLIIPYYFRDKISEVKCITKNKKVYVFNKDVSMLFAIEEIMNYLKYDNDIFEIEKIYLMVNDVGYFNNFNKKEGIIYENKTES